MSELRYDPVRKTWVIIAAARGMRPSDMGSREATGTFVPRAFCPFCPGNEDRTPPEILAVREPGSKPDGPGWKIRVIPNKFPALTLDTPPCSSRMGIYKMAEGFGTHEVVVETPSDVEQMADFTVGHLGEVFAVYRDRLVDLGKDERFESIMVFKNYRPEAGASLRHSHSQIIATPVLPNLLEVEMASAHEHFVHRKRCLICDIIRQEQENGERIVVDSDLFIAFTPFASRFPLELRVVPRIHGHDFTLLEGGHFHHLAVIVKDVLTRLRGVLDDPPYNLILHTAPPTARRTTGPDRPGRMEDEYHWYLELIPRVTTIAGFEWGTGFQINPTSPEDAARLLREKSRI